MSAAAPAWPTAVARRQDGTLLLTTFLAFAQKALNVRRDVRVALLFSAPTGSGLFEGQSHSRSYLSPPVQPLTHWYYLRLLITVEPEELLVRPPLAALSEPAAAHPGRTARQVRRSPHH
ncbi:hypothetical protein ACH4XT_01460 [Streptomyces avidinii]|uniref:hypothetical protein n=1 Tax=Streptomyces avidinii TaxID=1895 RepID=UPI0037B107E5